MRDSQRSKVYRGGPKSGVVGQEFESVAQMQRYVDDVTSTAWWQTGYYYSNGVSKDYPRNVTVTDGRGRRHPAAYRNRWEPRIAMPRFARNERVLLHEIAHLMHGRCTAGHGPEFCRCWVDLVQYRMGTEAAISLHRSLIAEGCRVAPAQSRMEEW